MTPEGRWLAAIHEAGHAVVAVTVGYELKDVSIENAWRCRARLSLLAEQPGAGMTALTDEEENADALCLLAGGKAELEVPDVEEETPSFFDREHFNTLGPRAASAAALEAWRYAMERQAQQIVRRKWDAILAVADALQRRGILSHAEVRRLMEASASHVR